MINEKMLNIGDRARVKTTGQLVTIDQISSHGFALVRFNTGAKHRFLNHHLEPVADRRSSVRLQ